MCCSRAMYLITCRVISLAFPLTDNTSNLRSFQVTGRKGLLVFSVFLEPEAADFQGDVEAARTAINSWVSQETQNKIENLLSQGSLSTFTRLVLVNALYFKGEWKILFNERLTRPGPFKVSGDVTKDVPIMRTQGRFPFVQDTELQCTAVAMPYVGADLDMVVVVPHRESSLTDLVDKLTSHSFNSLLSDMDRYPNQIYLSLPKFQVTASSNLKDALSALGMSSAFLEKEADLSGISPDKDLFVSAVEHKVHVAVDEKGAEAAAATAVVANSFSMSPPEIDVDRPFLFAIRDKRPGGGLLFLGSVFDPQA